MRLCFRSYPWAPEHMPRVAVVIRACSFTEYDDIGAVQVCRASRCSSAFWMCASLEVLHDLISVVVIQCRQGGNIMASGPPSCSCSRYRRGIGRGTVCEGQALAQAAGTGRASSELAIRRLPSLRLCFRSYPWAPEHMPRVAVVIRACSFTEYDDIGAVQVCRASRCSSAFWMCASLEVLHDLISVVVIQCRQGGNIMASGPPSCSCSRYLWEGCGEEIYHIAQP